MSLEEVQAVVDALHADGWFVEGVVADELNMHLLPDLSEERRAQVIGDVWDLGREGEE